VRFALNGSSGLLRTVNGLATAVQAYEVGVKSMQGATMIRGKFVMSVSDTVPGSNGDLVTYTPGAASVTRFTNHLPIVPEDVSYWAAQNRLWTLTESAGKRSVVGIRASAYA